MKVTYNGPAGQVNYEVGIESGNPELEPGAVYDLSEDLTSRLLESSAWWVKGNKSKTTDE